MNTRSETKRLVFLLCEKKRYLVTLLMVTVLLARNLAGFHGVNGNGRHLESPHKATTATNETAKNTATGVAEDPITIDFLSIGSLGKRTWQDGQLATFGAHPAVRNFFLVDERNDTDATCHTNFTDDQLREVLRFCNNTGEEQSFESKMIRKKLFWPKRHTGWLCAQKRPIDGIYSVVQHYLKNKTLPSYLMIIDDDTFVNVDSMLETFREHYPITDNHVVAGCRYTYPRKIAFAFPYGGFSSILTRSSLKRLIQPIYCKSESSSHANAHDDEEFNRMACWRLEQNLIGEAEYFNEGMSVGELMYQYGANLPFTGVRHWNRTGFCMHSDHSLGYFFNFYHLAAPHGILERRSLDDKIRMEYSYEFLAGDKQCGFEKHSCVKEARICHYVRPERMVSLHAEQQAMTSS